jgi:tetratricopeptide (TPR) repeat protein
VSVMREPVELFYSYAHRDEELRKELEKHLSVLKRENVITSWHDRMIGSGDDWAGRIDEHINTAQVILLLVSADFLASDYCYDVEMKRALERHEANEARVIPVILRECEWQATRLKRLQALPTGAKPVDQWTKLDAALSDVAREIRKVVADLKREPAPAKSELENSATVSPCPYRGLEAFHPEHEEFFFGREELTKRMAEKLRREVAAHRSRFLAVVGPSGSGKSSLTLAGLVPALKRDALGGGVPCSVAICRPGSDPLENLAVKLSSVVRGGSSFEIAPLREFIRSLHDSPDSLHLFTRQSLSDSPPAKKLVVVVDQFEEVFTLCEDQSLRQAFFDNLLYAAGKPDGQTVVVLTLRADFYGKCASYRALAEVIENHQLLVGPMSEDELSSAIERPAQLVGCELETGLTDILLQDIERQPGALPLLQFALLELWKRRERHGLTIAAYRQIGGLEGALENRANAVLADFTRAEQDICRRVFLRLTHPGEGTEDTKRRARKQELVHDGDDVAGAVVQRLVDARLITAEGEDGGQSDRSGSLEVAHEALIRGWTVLRQWIDADRAGLRTQHRLVEAAHEWDCGGRDPGYLYSGARLAEASEWAGSHQSELIDLESAFLSASEEAKRKREEAEINRERERAADAQRIADEAKKKLRASRIALAAVLVACSLGVAMVWSARSEIDRQARLKGEAREALESARGHATEAQTRDDDPSGWEAAVQAAEGAVRLARSVNGDDAFLKQIKDGADELTKRRDQARKQRERANKDAYIRGRLEEARIKSVGTRAEENGRGFDFKAVVAEYRLIFGDYSINLDSLPDPKAIAIIRNSSIKESLTAALDDCASATSDLSLDLRLRALARETDPDKHRTAVRDAVAKRDHSALKSVATAADVANLPRATIEALARALRSLRDRDGAVQLLRRAHRHHPNDFWINFLLGEYSSELVPPSYEQALGYYRAALAIRPDSPGVYRRIGYMLATLGDDEGAIAEYDRALELNPRYAVVFAYRANIWINKSDYDRSIADCTEAIRLNPNDSYAYRTRGYARHQKNLITEAIADYTEAIRLNPRSAFSYYKRGQCWSTKKDKTRAVADYDSAIAEADRAIRLDPTDYDAFLNRGYARSLKHEVDKAIDDYTEAIRLNPKSANAYLERGMARAENQKYAQAVSDYSQAILLDQKYFWAYNNRGNAFHDLGQDDKAIADFDFAISLDPKNALVYNNRGVSLRTTKKYDEAIADFNTSIRLDPDYARAYHNRGYTWDDKKDYDKAITDYDVAIRIDPSNAGAFQNRGAAWRAKKEYDKAVDDFSAAIRLDPVNAQAYVSLGNAWRDKQEYDKAIAAYDDAIRLRPQMTVAKNSRATAFKAKTEKLIADCTEALRQNPSDASLLYRRAGAWLDNLEYDKAIADFTQCIRLDPKCASAFAKLGMAHGKRAKAMLDKGDYDKAIVDFDEAILADASVSSLYIDRGSAWGSKEMYDKAIADFDVAIKLDPNHSAAYYKRGIARSRIKEHDKAIADLDTAIRLDPRSSPAFLYRGDAWVFKNEYDKAIADYNVAIRIDSRNALAYFGRGAAHGLKKEASLAIEDYSAAIRLDPRLPMAFHNRGAQYFNRQQFIDAIADFDAAIRLNPRFALPHGGRGLAWLNLNELDQAIADFEVAIRLDPKQAYVFNGRGAVLAARNEFEKALNDYSEAIRLDPKFALAYRNRAATWLSQKKYDKALGDYNEAIRLEPNNPSTYNNVAWLVATCRVDSVRDSKAAVLNATKACELTEFKNPEYLDTLAASYAAEGQFDKAVETQTRAIGLLTGKETKEYRERFENRLQLYRQRKPYRQEPK